MSCEYGNFAGIVERSQTLLHEMIHLLGYSHGETPEMAYSCTLACGSEVTQISSKTTMST